MAENTLLADQNAQVSPEAAPQAEPAPVPESLPPNLVGRQQKHLERGQAIEDLLVKTEALLPTLEGEAAQLLQTKAARVQLDAECRGLAAQVEQLNADKARLAEESAAASRELEELRATKALLLREDELFGQEHVKTDRALNEQIERLRRLAQRLQSLVNTIQGQPTIASKT